MRTLLITILVSVLITITGCTRSGDFGTFLTSEVTRYGGHTKTNAALPELEARWTIQRDRNGFTDVARDAPFTSIDAVMRQAFGSPKVSVETNAHGFPQRVYSATDIGVAIQCIGHGDCTEIICLKANSMPPFDTPR